MGGTIRQWCSTLMHGFAQDAVDRLRVQVAAAQRGVICSPPHSTAQRHWRRLSWYTAGPAGWQLVQGLLAGAGWQQFVVKGASNMPSCPAAGIVQRQRIPLRLGCCCISTTRALPQIGHNAPRCCYCLAPAGSLETCHRPASRAVKPCADRDWLPPHACMLEGPAVTMR